MISIENETINYISNFNENVIDIYFQKIGKRIDLNNKNVTDKNYLLYA